MVETKRGVGPDPATSETVAADTAPSAPSGEQATRGEQIDRFVVLGTLGKGGMGVVYSAYDPQLDRKVAIKLLSGDTANADAQTRLLREAQAMAKIRHPNVIVVHDVGTYRDQVYVAMEYADGGTLRAWLEAAQRDQREILDVFVQAGRGLAAAHAAGLVHRDFKPENVLRSRDGRVHVTDFGLVGVMSEQEATERPRRAPTDYEKPVDTGPTPLTTDLTQTGAIMGTPRYMAPEQFHGALATARTDQFSFCVALYEALHGERPFAGTSYAELCANVTTGTMSPPPRNARVPAWLRRVLLRGLATEPAARYPSMDALLAALGRSPQRRGVALALGAVAVCGIGAAVMLATRAPARPACGDGSDHIQTAWSPARRAAMQAAFSASHRPLAASIFERSAVMLDAWTRSWQSGYVAACEATRVKHEQSDHLLDLRMQCLERRLDETRAAIDAATAGGADAVDHALEAFGALPLLRACADREALLAEVAPPETAAARTQVAAVRAQIDRARGTSALGKISVALEQARAAMTAATASGYAPVIAEAGMVLGRAQLAAGDVAPALTSVREAMQVAARAGDTTAMLRAITLVLETIDEAGSHYEGAEELAALAGALDEHARPAADLHVELEVAIAQIDRSRNRLDSAQARFEAALAVAEKQLGPDHTVTLRARLQLGGLYRDRARFDDARKAIERVLAADERITGKDHPDYASVLVELASVQRRQGKLADAKQTLEQALAIDRLALGEDHPALANIYVGLGNVASEQGDPAASLASHERAGAVLEKAYGPDSTPMETVLLGVGSALADLRRHDEARDKLSAALALSEKLHGHDNRREVDIYNDIGQNEFNAKRLDEAMDAYQHARDIAIAVGGPETGDVVDIDMNIANVYFRKNELDESIEIQRRAIAVARTAYGPDHPRLGMLLANLAHNEDLRKHYADALADYQLALPIFIAKFGEDHMYTFQVVTQTAEELDSLRRYDEAIPMYQRALAIAAKVNAPPPLVTEVGKELAVAQRRRGSHR